MTQEPTIKTIASKQLVGLSTVHSLANNQAAALWQAFMPRRHEIQNVVGEHKLCVHIYPPDLNLAGFNPATEFTTWAAVEVDSYAEPLDNMQTLVLPAGQYAVFIHRGTVKDFQKTIQYIHGEWFPSSSYQLDDRPHFEWLDERYKGPNNTESLEEVWIPIKTKALST